MAAIPLVGQAAFFGLAREGSYQTYRQEFEAAGDSWELANEKAMTLSLPSAALEMAFERLQIKALAGKMPFLERRCSPQRSGSTLSERGR